MIEYIIASYLTASACAATLGCHLIPQGDSYQSLTPTQRPNWCVVNKRIVAAGAMLSFATPTNPRLLMGPGVRPCGLPKGRIEPKPMS